MPTASDLNGPSYWAGVGGQGWAERQAVWDTALAPLTGPLMERAEIGAGARVLDVGCGAGATVLAAIERVGPHGHVTGIDISAELLAVARRRVPAEAPVDLVLADATTHPLAVRAFDRIVSRLGVMFFDRPDLAFANLHGALMPGGGLCFVCFREPKLNPALMLAVTAAYRHVPPLPKQGPDDPGAFSFADPDRVRRILATAGFADVRLEPLDLMIDVAGGMGLDAAVDTALRIGAASRAIVGQPPDRVDAVADAIREAYAARASGMTVPLPAALWIVTANAIAAR